MIDLIEMAERAELIAEHIADDQPNLPLGAKNHLLLMAKEFRSRSEAGQLNVLADIRAAVGDPHGKLMHDELLSKVAGIMRVHAASLEWLDAREAHRHCGGNEVTKSMAAYIAAKRRLKQAIEGAG